MSDPESCGEAVGVPVGTGPGGLVEGRGGEHAWSAPEEGPEPPQRSGLRSPVRGTRWVFLRRGGRSRDQSTLNWAGGKGTEGGLVGRALAPGGSSWTCVTTTSVGAPGDRAIWCAATSLWDCGLSAMKLVGFPTTRDGVERARRGGCDVGAQRFPVARLMSHSAVGAP